MPRAPRAPHGLTSRSVAFNIHILWPGGGGGSSHVTIQGAGQPWAVRRVPRFQHCPCSALRTTQAVARIKGPRYYHHPNGDRPYVWKLQRHGASRVPEAPLVLPPPPPSPPPVSVGPNFSRHKARVQAMGWFPVGNQETGEQPFCCPLPPPNGSGTEWVTDPTQPPPPPPARPLHPRCRLAHPERGPSPHGRGGGGALQVENFGIWDLHGNLAGGPPFPNKWGRRANERTSRLPLP